MPHIIGQEPLDEALDLLPDEHDERVTAAQLEVYRLACQRRRERPRAPLIEPTEHDLALQRQAAAGEEDQSTPWID